MHSTSIRRGGTFAAVVIASLLLFATACGGGSKSSSTNESSSNGSTATTAASGGSSGTVDVSNCSSFFKKFNEVSNQIDASMSSTTGVIDWSGVVTALDSLNSSVPSEIKSDWNTLVTAFKKIATTMKGIDMSNPAAMTPQQLAELESLSASMNSPEIEKASANLTAYAQKNCPQMNN